MARAKQSPLEQAARAIEREGALLVYPIDNKREPGSLWYTLHPRTPMRWAWDEGADMRVVRLWQLREQLAHGREVVYTKWYRGRATFFSRALFSAMLTVTRGITRPLSAESRELLALLEEDSPRSTKQLRRAAGLTGKASERVYTRALRELWERLSIVGTGEVDDGAFPSLAIGATRWIFEDLWEESGARAREEAEEFVAQALPAQSPFGKYWRKLLKP